MKQMLRWIAPLLLLASSPLAGAVAADVNCPRDGVDQLLRRCQAAHRELPLPTPKVSCRQHEAELEQLDIDGRRFSWQQYADWGRQLFDNGYVVDPPAGPLDPWDPQRSRLISDFADYSCGRCHNDEREDPVLIDQDPDARYQYIVDQKPPDFRTSDLKMVQGVTMWGGVNRVRFYNQHFSFFDSICVPTGSTLFRSPDDPRGEDYEPVDCSPARFAPCSPGCRKLDTASFRDAIQTCGRYCGVGRFLEDWELAGLLTHFWNGQVRLSAVVDSLDNQLAGLRQQDPLPAQKIAVVGWKIGALERWLAESPGADGDSAAAPSIAACEALADSYLLTSCEALRDQSPDDPDNEACSRDWTAGASTLASEAREQIDEEDLPAMIRHIRSMPARPTIGPALAATRPSARQVPLQALVSHRQPAAEPATDQLRRGKHLYELSCARCHGASPEGMAQVGGRGDRFLVGSSHVFFKLIEDGLTPKNPIPPNPADPSQESLYMPEFTLQRLSYQQAEDIYQYLLSLPPVGKIERQSASPGE